MAGFSPQWEVEGVFSETHQSTNCIEQQDHGLEGGAMTDTETVFDVLANRRRRWVLGVLALSPRNPISVRGLAESIAAFEFENPTTTQTKRVRTSLRRTHLAALEDLDAIHISQDGVSPGPAFHTIFHVLAVGLTHQPHTQS